jgi:hypothetical protein
LNATHNINAINDVALAAGEKSRRQQHMLSMQRQRVVEKIVGGSSLDREHFFNTTLNMSSMDNSTLAARQQRRK